MFIHFREQRWCLHSEDPLQSQKLQFQQHYKEQSFTTELRAAEHVEPMFSCPWENLVLSQSVIMLEQNCKSTSICKTDYMTWVCGHYWPHS